MSVLDPLEIGRGRCKTRQTRNGPLNNSPSIHSMSLARHALQLCYQHNTYKGIISNPAFYNNWDRDMGGTNGGMTSQYSCRSARAIAGVGVAVVKPVKLKRTIAVMAVSCIL